MTEEALKVGVPLKAFVDDPAPARPRPRDLGAGGHLEDAGGNLRPGSFVGFPGGYAFEDEEGGDRLAASPVDQAGASR